MICEECKNCKNPSGVLYYTTRPGGSKYLIIHEHPYEEDLENTEILSQEFDLTFKAMLQTVGINIEDCTLTYLLKCIPGDGKFPDRDLSDCLKALYKEIYELKPENIIILGKRVAKALLTDQLPEKFKVAEIVHKPRYILFMRNGEYKSYKAYVLYHPKYVHHHKNSLSINYDTTRFLKELSC